jgi:predicted ArsR family transcriptional regulator
MPKTIKELSEEIGVSKQAINRFLTSDFRRQHVTTKTDNKVGALLVDKSGEILIKKHFSIDNDRQQTDNDDRQQVVGLLEKQIENQQRELAEKNKQIEAKDTQISNLQNLLDQSQQLQLISEKKLAENKQMIEIHQKEAMESHKSFFHHLFHK